MVFEKLSLSPCGKKNQLRRKDVHFTFLLNTEMCFCVVTHVLKCHITMEKNNPTPASLYASLFPLQASDFMKWIIVPEGDGKL